MTGGLSLATAARLLAIHQRAFDNSGTSRSILKPRQHHGVGMTVALFIIAAALVVFGL